MPFHHLQSDEVWSALNAEGGPSPDYRMTRFVRLDPEFRDFASDPLSRLQARSTLVKTYFQPDEQLSLYEAMGIPVPQEDELNRAVLGADAREASERGRDVRFRVNVVAAYNYTCSLTGYRLLTVSAGAIVDAAHIHQFAKSKNDDPRNGIALCKNAHWLFDNGLWSIDDDYTVLIAQGRFAEDSPDQRGLAHYKGLRVRLPSDTRLWPARTHLAWHRKNKFLGTGDE